jgi:hypothetical protein
MIEVVANKKLPLRYVYIRDIQENKSFRKKVNAMVEYYHLGGHIENIFNFLEGDKLAIRSIRDVGDWIASRAIESGVKIKKGYIDQNSNSVVLVVEHCHKAMLQECANYIGKEVKVHEGKENTILIFRCKEKAEGFLSEDVAKLSTEKLSTERLANEYGLSFQHVRDLQNVKCQGTKHFEGVCPNCDSEAVRIKKRVFECRSCGYKARMTNGMVETYKKSLHCSECGKITKSSNCPNCGQKILEVVTSTAMVAPMGYSGNSQLDQAKGVIPGSCPKCGGTVAGVGDAYRCLTCGENIQVSELSDESKSYTLKPGKHQKVYHTKEGKEFTITQDLLSRDPLSQEFPNSDPPEEIQPGDIKDEVPAPLVLNEYAVFVRDSDKAQANASNVYQMMLDSGLLSPGSIVLNQTPQGWVEADGSSSGQFLISVPDETTAQRIYDSLSSQGYSVEMGNAQETPLKKEKMAYPGYSQPGSTFDYSNFGTQVPKAQESSLPKKSNLSMKEFLQNSLLSLNTINEGLTKQGMPSITQNQLNLIAHLHSKRSPIKEMAHKTGLSIKVLEEIIGKKKD